MEEPGREERSSSPRSLFPFLSLQLRDHLALAGTCRYFRTVYRDGESSRSSCSPALLTLSLRRRFGSQSSSRFVRARARARFLPSFPLSLPIFKIRLHLQPLLTSLFFYFSLKVLFKYYFSSSPDCPLVSPFGQIHSSPRSFSFVGPSDRSPGEARKIFSHTFKVSQDGWGVSDEDWENHAVHRVQQGEGRSLINFLDKERAAYMLVVRKEYVQKFKKETIAWEAKATRFAGAAAAKVSTQRVVSDLDRARAQDQFDGFEID